MGPDAKIDSTKCPDYLAPSILARRLAFARRPDSAVDPIIASLVPAVGLAFIHLPSFTVSQSGNPIPDWRNFRQTQTEISAYDIIDGGSGLTYETLFLGAPCSIPFEAPIWQRMVALIIAASPWSIDDGSRFITRSLAQPSMNRADTRDYSLFVDRVADGAANSAQNSGVTR